MKNGKYGISDVAEMLGVSKSTVSRVINGNDRSWTRASQKSNGFY